MTDVHHCERQRVRERIIWSGAREREKHEVQMQWAPPPPKVLPGPVARRSQAWLVQHYAGYRSPFCPGQTWVRHDRSRTRPTRRARSSAAAVARVAAVTGRQASLVRPLTFFSALLTASCVCVMHAGTTRHIRHTEVSARQLSFECTYTSVSCRCVKVLKFLISDDLLSHEI